MIFQLDSDSTICRSWRIVLHIKGTGLRNAISDIIFCVDGNHYSIACSQGSFASHIYISCVIRIISDSSAFEET